MDYDLSEFIKQYPNLSIIIKLEILLQIINGLENAHQKEIIHTFIFYFILI